MVNYDKTISSVMKIHYYYFVVLSLLNALFIYFKIDIGYTITTIIMIISIVFQLLIGYLNGILGLPAIIIIIGLSIYLSKGIWLGISIGLSIVGIINFLVNEIFNKILHFIIKITKKV